MYNKKDTSQIKSLMVPLVWLMVTFKDRADEILRILNTDEQETLYIILEFLYVCKKLKKQLTLVSYSKN